ncbi:MAG: hypothetical protein HY741_12770 [Chloroflexi bacterium]|nr:hypothetical protein [Chloroflexota bacterium]
MATIHLPPDLREFLQLLNAHQVEYLLIGGYAVGYHGYPRATGDMDIWVAIHPQNAERVVAVIKAFGFDLPELSPDIFLQKNKIIQMGISPVKIDVTTTVSGVEFQECYAARQIETLDGILVNLISLPHLKANKKASGRLKDLNDLQNLP